MIQSFNLSETLVHLGLGATAVPLPDFRWDEEYLDRYVAEHASDGDEGRLVMISRSQRDWTFWERHPGGDELVVVLSGHLTLVQDHDGREERVELQGGKATINPRGVWHTSDVHEAGDVLFITPGRGTEHRPR